MLTNKKIHKKMSLSKVYALLFFIGSVINTPTIFRIYAIFLAKVVKSLETTMMA